MLLFTRGCACTEAVLIDPAESFTQRLDALSAVNIRMMNRELLVCFLIVGSNLRTSSGIDGNSDCSSPTTGEWNKREDFVE